MEKLNKVFRTAQLAAIDKYTIEHEPVSSLDLMERAAGIWTDRFLKIFTEVAGVVVIAGNGNNGGDGYAIARLLNRRSEYSGLPEPRIEVPIVRRIIGVG